MDAQSKKQLVLVIDDDENDRLLLGIMLEEGGYEFAQASGGEEGLRLFEQLHPDIVMVDLRMPGMDGLEVLDEISRKQSNTPVIVVSGSELIDDAIQAIRLGASDYLLKPVNEPSILFHTLNKNLERAMLIKQNERFRRNLESQLQKLYADEEAGRKIQNRLLPPVVWNCGDYTMRQAILSSMALSGDFLDYFKINGSCFAFYSADVAGHGVSSALVTVLLKSFMVKYRDNYVSKGEDTILNPAALVKILNSELLREQLDKHMTLFFGIVNCSHNTLLYCNCGQYPYPILITADGTRLLDDKSMAVGMFEFAEYRNSQIDLPASFRLNVFSDGALDLVERSGVEDKVGYLASLATEGKVQAFWEQARKIDNLPDDISILSMERNWEGNHE